MKKYVLVFIILLTLLPLSASADCDKTELLRLQKIANNVTAGYEYYVATNDKYYRNPNQVVFKIILTGLNNDIYIYDPYNYAYYFESLEKEIGRYYPGTKVNYQIYANSDNCKGTYLKTLTVKLPIYNIYSESDECKKIPEYKLCKKWGISPSEKEFSYGIEKYKIKSHEQTEQSNYTNVYSVIFDFFIKCYFIILPIIIIFGTTIIIILNKKRGKVW